MAQRRWEVLQTPPDGADANEVCPYHVAHSMCPIMCPLWFNFCQGTSYAMCSPCNRAVPPWQGIAQPGAAVKLTKNQKKRAKAKAKAAAAALAAAAEQGHWHWQ